MRDKDQNFGRLPIIMCVLVLFPAFARPRKDRDGHGHFSIVEGDRRYYVEWYQCVLYVCGFVSFRRVSGPP